MMTNLAILRRVLARARHGKAQLPGDLGALEAAVAAIEAGQSADKAFGLKRKKAGRPPKTREQREADVELVARVLATVEKLGINQDEAGIKVVGSESKLCTMNRKVARYRKTAEWLLRDELVPVESRQPDDPSAEEDFAGQ